MEAVNRRIVSHLVQGCLQGDTRILTNHNNDYKNKNCSTAMISKQTMKRDAIIQRLDKKLIYTVLQYGASLIKTNYFLKGRNNTDYDEHSFTPYNSSTHSQAKLKD